MTLSLLLYIIALILLLLAALGVNAPRISLGWLGLAVITFTAFLLPHL
jgi:hypothetical protein